jgi:hypothetical protein
VTLDSIRIAIGLLAAAAVPDTPPYRHIDHPPDPAAQLAEMVAIFDGICLRAFPDDKAVARAMADRKADALSGAQVRRYLHQDPGVGWRIAGRTAAFDVTIEAPPFHACGVRTLTAAGFPDMAPYRALADRFEAGGGYRPLAPYDQIGGNVRSRATGESRDTGNGGAESLFSFSTTPTPETRTPAQDSIEIRFVHQFAPPPPVGPKA